MREVAVPPFILPAFGSRLMTGQSIEDDVAAREQWWLDNKADCDSSQTGDQPAVPESS